MSRRDRGLIVANFDCEVHYARLRCPGPHKELPGRIREAVAQASVALQVFTAGGDTLWTMSPLAHSEGLAGLQTVSGPVADLVNDFERVLAWGSVKELPATEVGNLSDMSWQEKLWHLRAPFEVAAACNDRRLLLTVDVEPAWRLDLQVVGDLDELDEYIATAPLGPDDSWVAKAPLSAAGRERVRRRGRRLQGEMRVRCERLFSRYGQLVMEPWMPRVADYGVAGLISDSETTIWPPHRLRSDGTGIFRGIRIADRECEIELGPDYCRALSATASEVARVLCAHGYRGPFGIDSFVYTDRRGNNRLQCLSEINARLNFGLVARGHAEAQGANDFEFVAPSLPA